MNRQLKKMVIIIRSAKAKTTKSNEINGKRLADVDNRLRRSLQNVDPNRIYAAHLK